MAAEGQFRGQIQRWLAMEGTRPASKWSHRSGSVIVSMVVTAVV